MKKLTKSITDHAPLLRRPLTLLAWSTIISMIILIVAAGERRAAAERLQRAEARSAQAHGKVTQLGKDLRLLQANLPGFRKATTTGVLDIERREEWVEQLRKISARRKLAQITYRIDPQQTLVPPLREGRFEARASRMRIQLELLHEEDLLVVLDDLAASRLGLFALRACSITRLEANGKRFPRLLGECTIDWLSIVESGRETQAAP